MFFSVKSGGMEINRLLPINIDRPRASAPVGDFFFPAESPRGSIFLPATRNSSYLAYNYLAYNFL
jgi:hypothetical protein